MVSQWAIKPESVRVLQAATHACMLLYKCNNIERHYLISLHLSVVSVAVGIVASGLPLSLIARFYNWHASFIVLGYLSMGSALLAYFSQWPFSPPSEQEEVDNAEEKKTN